MTLQQVPAALLHQIEEELDRAEMETMRFLCQDLVHDLPSSDCPNVLVTLQERDVLTPVFLAELLYTIRRFDLLKKFLGSGKAAVEAHLARYPHRLSKYRVLMTEIDEELDKEDLRSLVFLLSGALRSSSSLKTARGQSFLTIITELEKLQMDHLGLLETCFWDIHRRDLAKKIQKYRQEGPEPPVATSKHANVLQVSFPQLSLHEPPEVMNKERLINGACTILGEQVQAHISIPETGGSQAQASSTYRMRSQPLGICLIIDCIGNDAGMLVSTFKALGFEVRCHFFLSVESLVRELYEVANLKQHKDYDCFVCILVSRGNKEGIFCTDTALSTFSLEKVKEAFTCHRCQYLAGKPKLFFIQNYVEPINWSETTNLIETDGDLCTIPQVADILWSECTLDASALEKAPDSSSYYLAALTELLTDSHKRKLPLLDILLELNDKVYGWNRINPTEKYSLLLKHTLRKCLFLSGS